MLEERETKWKLRSMCVCWGWGGEGGGWRGCDGTRAPPTSHNGICIASFTGFPLRTSGAHMARLGHTNYIHSFASAPASLSTHP